MRVALISDLHGNHVALAAVLADIAEVGVDRVVCLGDVATLGPRPREVIQMLRELACPCILGNHDAFMLDEALIRSYTEHPLVVDSVDWCRAQLGAEDFEYLRGLTGTLDVALDAETTLFLFHGSPSSHMQDLLATTPADELDALLGPRRTTVMAGGHTHLQMLRQHRGTLLVNPGSVGAAFKEYAFGGPPTLLPHAEYAVVESRRGVVDVSLRRVPFDTRALRSAVESSDIPLRPMLLAQYG
jgi:predicted phosphodiesterase